MEVGESSASDLYRPCMGAVDPSCGRIVVSLEPAIIDGVEQIREVGDSQLVGVPLLVAANAVAAGGEGSAPAPAPAPVDVEVKEEVKVVDSSGGKRKRGRPPRGEPRPPPVKKMKEEEDVCFICFDGGSLVLCDRRGCPKAYHPACIKRDEAFFRSRARWNCGWHICSTCQKAAHYMCYTCTYSLCKGCTKDSDYLCVRQNKGFCSTCMRTIMLIENKEQRDKEMAQVDFDDKSSWEYLFKMYWLYVKGKLSLTLDELIQAKQPWKAAVTITSQGIFSDRNSSNNVPKPSVSDIASGCQGQEANDSATRCGSEQPELLNHNQSLDTNKLFTDEGASSAGSTEWASKDLLEFVAHVKNGDMSELSPFDVQALLLNYVKRNNLRDPRRKSQVICDTRLVRLFGKPRVGHFEMLKLLEYHFLRKDESQKNVTQGNVYAAAVSQVEVNGDSDIVLTMGKDKKRKTRKKGEEKGLATNLDEYAAIDVHNISLIYLPRNLMENLIIDSGKFHDKVVGSVVRIRISGNDQKQDMYRLVQVVGTCKVAVPYKIGEKSVDVMLEILNLDKKETISIDAISNQEFSEDECRRLRQSIKCGLVKRQTVGQIQEKAMVLREVKLNDWMETEVLRLNHLRDRASEKGHKKELRECVEKLELLKTSEERQRRLQEIPDIHADPNMNPNYNSDEDGGELGCKKKVNYMNPGYYGYNKNGRGPILSRSTDRSNDTCNRAGKDGSCKQNKNMSSAFYSGASQRMNKFSRNEGNGGCESNCTEKPVNVADSSSTVAGWNNQAVLRSGSLSGVASEASIASLSVGSGPSAYDSETQKLWHYRDPNGNAQGPFCMVQLRKWSTTGYFPSDLRVWSIYKEEVDSLLLTDVLKWHAHKSPSLQYNVSLPSQEVVGASEDRLHHCISGSNSSLNSTGIDSKQSNSSQQFCSTLAHSNSDNEAMQGSCDYSSRSCGESWRPPSVSAASGDWDLNSCFGSEAMTKSMVVPSERNYEAAIPNLPSPTPENEGDFKSQTSKEEHVVSSNVSIQNSTIQNLPSPVRNPSSLEEISDSCSQDLQSSTQKQSDGDEKVLVSENKHSVSSDISVQDSAPSWSGTLSLGMGATAELAETADEWVGYSPTPAKPPVKEWDSGTVSAPSLQPSELSNDHAASPTPDNDQLKTLTSHAASNASGWRAIVPEPIELSTLAEESMSDLLAEVDAMESQGGLVTPTSAINFIEDLFGDPKKDCFTSIEILSPPRESGKNDALSSIGDIQLPPPPLQSGLTDEPSRPLQAGVLGSLNGPSEKSSRSPERDVEIKPTNEPVNQQKESVSNSYTPSIASQDIADADTKPKAPPQSQPLDAGWNSKQGNVNLGPGGSTEGPSSDWSTKHGNEKLAQGGSAQGPLNVGQAAGVSRASTNQNRSGSAVYNGWDGRPRYGAERFAGPRDWTSQVADPGRGRPSWSRQSSFGSGGSGSGGNYSRAPPKGQRVCKFYESGHCKKGAFCDYLHP